MLRYINNFPQIPLTELVLPEKTWKEKKIVFFNIKFTTYISELLNLGVEITAPNGTLHYENLPKLFIGFLHPLHFPQHPYNQG